MAIVSVGQTMLNFLDRLSLRESGFIFFLSLKYCLTQSLPLTAQSMMSSLRSTSKSGVCTAHPSRLLSLSPSLARCCSALIFLQFLYEKLIFMAGINFLRSILVTAFLLLYSCSSILLGADTGGQFNATGTGLLTRISCLGSAADMYPAEFRRKARSVFINLTLFLYVASSQFQIVLFSLASLKQEAMDPYFILQSEKYISSSRYFLFLKYILLVRNAFFLHSFDSCPAFSFDLEESIAYLYEVLWQTNFKASMLTTLMGIGIGSFLQLLRLLLQVLNIFIFWD